MSFELNKLKKELKNLDKEYKKYLNSAKTFKNENKIKNAKIEINTKEALIKIQANAKKEKEAFKRKANNAFNSPVKNKKLAKK